MNIEWTGKWEWGWRYETEVRKRSLYNSWYRYEYLHIGPVKIGWLDRIWTE